jgi:hypothetical protein
LDRSYFVNWDKLYVSAQTHQKILFQTHINCKNRLHSPKVFAELFPKSDRIPRLPILKTRTAHDFVELNEDHIDYPAGICYNTERYIMDTEVDS